MNTARRCKYCDERHAPRFLCDPARRVLDALLARGMSFNLPTIEFPDPIPGSQLGLGMGPHDALVSQVVIQAATVPVAGVIWPAVILTGRNANGEELPKWLYTGDAEDMTRLNTLMSDVTAMAVRAAAEGRTVQ